jgi:hypothetical protein
VRVRSVRSATDAGRDARLAATKRLDVANNKWVFAAQAIVAALDQPVFDTMSVGLMAAPNAK